MIKVALVGNPNAGKTTLFNSLTGSSARVSNWPGVTIDKKTGFYKKLGEKIEIIDLPGLYSFNPYTNEEKIARDYILDEQADVIINIVDATNLERNLYLTTQLLEMDVPIVIALNFIDVIEKDNIYIDMTKLSNLLGVPVIPISALKNKSLKELMANVLLVSKTQRLGKTIIESSCLGSILQRVTNRLEKDETIKHRNYHAVKLIENDHYELAMHPELASFVNELKTLEKDDIFHGDYAGKIADCRYKFITHNIKKIIVLKAHKPKISQSLDKILTHKFWGIPLFAFIMFLIFHLTFSEDLFFLNSLGIIKDGAFDLGVFGNSAINSPGVILFNSMDLLINYIGSLITLATNSSAPWVQSLFVDGIWAGVGAVLSFLPQIIVLFMFISMLEDTGYMARVAFMLDRLTRKFGLSGRAFLPLLMCFGCAVPGIMATRTLKNEKERRLTILLSPFFSCGAKLPIWLVFGAILFNGQYTDLIITSIYLLGIVVAIVTGYIANRFFIKSEASPFVMEMPEYRVPKWLNVFARSWEKIRDYVINAATIIAASTIIIWFLTSFSFSFQMTADSRQSMLGVISSFIAPIFIPLGFGGGDFGWVFVVASFTGLIAKEMVPSTLGTIAQVSGDVLQMGGSELLSSPLATIINTLTPGAAFAFMAFNLLTIPCMASVSAARVELKSRRHFILTLLLWISISYVSGVIVYLAIDYLIAQIVFGVIVLALITFLIIERQVKKKRGLTHE